MPREELPGPLQRSPSGTVRTYEKALGHSKEELYERAKQLGVGGRSRMSEYELAQAIARTQG
jgi:hypothetical protein